MLPFAIALGHGNKFIAVKHTGHAFDGKKALSERRALGGFCITNFKRAALHQAATWQKFQSGWIWSSFGLNKHDALTAGSRPADGFGRP